MRNSNYIIPFNKSTTVGNEKKYICDVIDNYGLCGDGKYTEQAREWIEKMVPTKACLLTTSGTHALEMAALLCEIVPGDEVIMPSYTFSSTANAFVLRGARIVFVDIRPDTMNMDENLIENAITEKTKAIVPVHYAGVGCEMDKIMNIAKKYEISVIEDAAQGICATYKDKQLGSIGDYGCYSFHETKNISMGEGGALLINDESKVQLAEIIREKGTNRKEFRNGKIDKYGWMGKGSSYLPSDILAAYLFAQLEQSNYILKTRMEKWNRYKKELEFLANENIIEEQYVPQYCKHNAHMFYIKHKDASINYEFMKFLKNQGILVVGHYVPLHSSQGGKKYGRFCGQDRFTSKESSRLCRLPMFSSLSEDEQTIIIQKIYEFYHIPYRG